MRRHSHFFGIASVTAAVLALSGCGGGTAASNGTTTTGRAAALNVYVTDGFAENKPV
jgi:hypothetical protein